MGVLYETYDCVQDGCDGECTAKDREDHCGLCPYCWVDLRPEDRATLKGQEPREVEVIERVRTIYPARSFLRTLALLSWRLGMTAAVVADLWAKWRQHHG